MTRPTGRTGSLGGKAPGGIDLSGHTHGMQMGLELPALGLGSPSRLRSAGRTVHEGKQHLHVNRGFGMLGFPGRIGIPPEITELTLRKAWYSRSHSRHP